MIKKILTSRWLRLILSVVLVYLAFRKVDVWQLLMELKKVPWWFVVAYIVYNFLVSIVGTYRWSLLLFGRPQWREVWILAKASYLAGFYALFLPSGMAGDLIKWIPLQKKYPELSKAKLFSSVVTDRIVGFTAYILVALMATLIGLALRFIFPIYLLWLFGGLFVGVVVFYAVVFLFNVENVILKIRIWKISRLVEIVNILKETDKRKLFKCFLISMIGEFVWILPVWFIGLMFDSGISLLSVYIFMPVIGLVLTLPISVAGFGAREQLYLYFFGQIGLAPEKILLVSAFGGVLGVVSAMIGGVIALII